MDRYFLDTIQPNVGYLSGSTIWKAGTVPSWRESLVVPSLNDLHFNDSYAVPVSKIYGGAGLSDYTGSFKDIGAVDFHVASATQLDYLKNNPAGLIFGNKVLPSTIFTEDEKPYWHILDANVDFKSLAKNNDINNFYTTPGVSHESNENLACRLPNDNIHLNSFTMDYFKENSVATLTSPFGDTSTVVFEKINNSTSYLACGHIPTGSFTNVSTGATVLVCDDILYRSKHDVELAVNAIAFYNNSTIFTEDKCLGFAFCQFGSFRPSINTSWSDYKNSKNNYTCSHNH